LREQLKHGDKSLVGNKGYRKYPDPNVFYVDCRYPAIEAEICRL
jgi:hypothetical protein